MRVLGIDPGATGALAILTAAGQLHDVHDMPVIDKDVSAALVHHWLLEHADDLGLAVIEHVHAMPKQGVASSFRFGRGKGVLEGVVAGFHCPVELPSPSKWKRDMGLDRSKDRARQVAIDLWPDHAHLFARVKDDGRAEAALLAEWGRRLLIERHQL